VSTSNTPSFQVTPPNSTLAITSMILGILGWTFLPLLGSIIAVITGHMAKNEIKNSRGRLGGDGMATAGVILGYTNLALGLCACLIIFLFPAVLAGFWTFGDQILNTVP
jgi:hypothetical protein